MRKSTHQPDRTSTRQPDRTSTHQPGRTSTHQPCQEAFKSILPEDIDWKPFPAFPPSARLAVVVGRPAEPGPYTISVNSQTPGGSSLHSDIGCFFSSGWAISSTQVS